MSMVKSISGARGASPGRNGTVQSRGRWRGAGGERSSSGGWRGFTIGFVGVARLSGRLERRRRLARIPVGLLELRRVAALIGRREWRRRRGQHRGGRGRAGGALVAVAVVAAVGLMASEGARFDGVVQMAAEQPGTPPDRSGGEWIVPLGALTPADVAGTVEAKVMDDEGYGVRRLHRVLDRRGATFKLDFGGPPSNARGGHPRRRARRPRPDRLLFCLSFGLLATAVLSGASDGLGGAITRHELGLEAQSLPVALGPVHFGAYANGGMAFTATSSGTGAAEIRPGSGWAGSPRST